MVGGRRAFLVRCAGYAALGAAGVACAPGADRAARQGPQPASLWGLTRGSVELDQQLAQQLVAATPGMQVKIDAMGGTYAEQIEKVKTLAAAGSAPDVFVHLDCAQTAPVVGRGGVLEPLDTYLGRDAGANVKEIEPEVQLQYRVARKTYGIARGIALSTLFYNQDLFGAAGVPAPPAEWGHRAWQMDAVLDLARRLTRRDGDGAPARRRPGPAQQHQLARRARARGSRRTAAPSWTTWSRRSSVCWSGARRSTCSSCWSISAPSCGWPPHRQTSRARARSSGSPRGGWRCTWAPPGR